MDKTTPSEVFLTAVRKAQPDVHISIFDSERINAAISLAELSLFQAFVEKWCADYPSTRRVGKVLEAYARHKTSTRTSQGPSKFTIHHEGLDLLSKLESEYKQKCADWERRQPGRNSETMDCGTGGYTHPPPPPSRPYCLPESFDGTIWATLDPGRDAKRVVEDAGGDDLPDWYSPVGMEPKPLHATVNA